MQSNMNGYCILARRPDVAPGRMSSEYYSAKNLCRET